MKIYWLIVVMDRKGLLRKMSPLDQLSEAAQDFICSRGKDRQLKRGEAIYSVGESPNAMYFVVSGLIGLTMVSDKGSEHLLRLFRPGQFFGHRSLFSGELYHASAVCLEPAIVFVVPKSDILEVVEKFPQFLKLIVKTLAAELGRAETQRVRLTEQDVLSRTAEAVVYLRELKPDHTWTRQEIANFCASTTPSVIRALAELESRGWIRQDGRKIEILDRDSLLGLSD